MPRLSTMLTLVLVAVVGIACTRRSPVLYPDARLAEVGAERVDRDREECATLGRQVASSGRGGELAREGLLGGTVGAAGGAVGGAIHGDAGVGAAAGAAGGAVAALLGNLLRPRPPHPTYAAVVSRCLHGRGYEVGGRRLGMTTGASGPLGPRSARGRSA